MFQEFNRLPDFYQGVACIGVGGVMMLYALGLFGKGITLVIIFLSIYLLGVGCAKIGLLHQINKTLAQIKHKR